MNKNIRYRFMHANENLFISKSNIFSVYGISFCILDILIKICYLQPVDILNNVLDILDVKFNSKYEFLYSI